MQKLTIKQAVMLGRVVSASLKNTWTRATNRSQCVTLASLYYRGLLARRAWRGQEGKANAAYEYRGADVVMDAVVKMIKERKP